MNIVMGDDFEDVDDFEADEDDRQSDVDNDE